MPKKTSLHLQNKSKIAGIFAVSNEYMSKILGTLTAGHNRIKKININQAKRHYKI